MIVESVEITAEQDVDQIFSIILTYSEKTGELFGC